MAAILRRGPRGVYHLISWDLQRHRFQRGQWMRGDVKLCGLSPNGAYLLYWAQQYGRAHGRRREADLQPYDSARESRPIRSRPLKGKELKRKVPRYQRGDSLKPGAGSPRRNTGTWTAVSRPPYFSALAIWPAFGYWTGGGFFASDREIILNEAPDFIAPTPNAPWPNWMRVRSFEEARAKPSWPPFEDPYWPEDEGARWPSVGRVLDGLREGGAEWVDFVHARTNGELLFGCDGRVYRSRNWRETAPESLLRASDRLADFTGLEFERLPPPPEAMRW